MYDKAYDFQQAVEMEVMCGSCYQKATYILFIILGQYF